MLLPYDLQRGLIVSGLVSPQAMILPPFYAGQSLATTLQALLPTGIPTAPYSVQALTGAVVSLSTVLNGFTSTLFANANWTPSGNLLTGTLAIPADALPVGVPYAVGILSSDLTTAPGVTHIETRCIIREFGAASPTPPPSTTGFLTDYNPAITSAVGGNGPTDLSGVDDTNLATYSSLRIREYATNPGVGTTMWVLEPDTDPLEGARSVQSLHHATQARSWRQRG